MNELIELGRVAYATHEFKEKDGYWAKQKARVRAETDQSITGRKKGGNSIMGIRNPDMIKQNFKGQMKGMGKGALVGGTAGAIASQAMKRAKGKRGKAALVGAAIGGAFGGLTGQSVGGYKADKKYLAKKGVNISRGGFKTELTPAARKKYLR